MPLLLLVPIIGAALFAGAAVNNAGGQAADFVTQTTPQPGPGGLPSWVVPLAVVGVGSLLLYKEGAKLLKL